MNVVILPSWFRLKSNRIAGSFFMEQAVAMAKRGHNVTIIDAQIIPTRIYLATERNIGIRRYTEDNVEIFEYKTCAFCTGRSAFLTIRLYELKVERLLKSILKEKKIDVIHAHSFYPAGAAAVRLGKKYNIPTVVTEHFSGLVTGKIQPDKAFDYVKPTFDDADATSCVSNFFADTIYKNYNLEKHPKVTPNILNPIFRYSEKKKSECFVFTTVARLVPLKRVENIIKAFGRLAASGSDVKLNIVGDGYKRQELEELSVGMGLEKHIKFFGKISREEVYEVLKTTDAFVHASDVETFGVVYIEALASGCPVIAVKNGGSEEIVTEDKGYPVEPDNIDSLHEAMEKMINNRVSFDRYAISSEITESYSERKIGKLYEELYEDAVRTHKQRSKICDE